MKFMLVSFAWIYARLFHLYLGRFKQEFLDEMQTLFQELIEFVNLSATFNYLLFLAGIAFILVGGWMATQLFGKCSAIEGTT